MERANFGKRGCPERVYPYLQDIFAIKFKDFLRTLTWP
jgi:hypothetical protein